MFSLPDTTSVTDFRDNFADHLRRLKRAKRTTMLTQNGRAAAVMLSPKDFESYAQAREFVETVRAIEESRRDFAAGRDRPWSDVEELLSKVGKRQPRRK